MTTSQIITILIIMLAYLVLMILIGFKYSNVSTSEQYFLGGRNLNGWVAAFSAEASVMSGWMLLGFPGAVYAMGSGQIWCGIGCFLGSLFNYLFVADRLRIYSKLNGSITVPQYLGRRFKSAGKSIQIISAIFIITFFVVYAASGLISGGKLVNSVFGLDYSVGVIICAVIILIYTFLGGFDAVCQTDFVQGIIMLFALIAVPIAAWGFVSGNFSDLLNQSNVSAGQFLSPAFDGGSSIKAVDVISQLGWGLAYAGLPHIIVRFMAIRNRQEVKRTKIVGLTIDFVGLVAAVAIGLIGRAFLVPEVLSVDASETVYMEVLKKLFLNHWNAPILCGIFIAGIVASIMSSSDSMLLTSSSTLSEDFYHGVIRQDATDKDIVKIGRITIVIVSVLAMVFALNPSGGVFKVSSIAWAGLGATFGPAVILSLYWKRMNANGAIAGMLSGGLLVVIWEYVPILGGQTPSVVTGLYSIVPGFVLSLVVTVIVSLCTKAPSEEVLRDFEAMVNYKEHIDR